MMNKINKKNVILSGSEGFRFFRAKPTQNDECGRSMVEILGVLAIIGVLSVAGIAGFKTAMTRHKANELLNEASKRAVVVAAQIVQGKQNLNINEFDNKLGYGSFDSVEQGDGIFILRVSGVKQDVCNQMKVLVGDSKNPIISADCTTMTYNSDLGEGKTEEPDPEKDLCRVSLCQTCEDDGMNNQVHGFEPEGTPCVQGGIDGQCDNLGHCVPVGADSCNASEQCGEGYFCHFGGTYAPNVCEKVRYKTSVINDVKYYYSTLTDLKSWCRGSTEAGNCIWGNLSYYGAEDWCKSLGKRLLTVQEYLENKEELMKVLPHLGGTKDVPKYWVQGGEPRDDGTVWAMRPDGYASTGGVVCR